MPRCAMLREESLAEVRALRVRTACELVRLACESSRAHDEWFAMVTTEVAEHLREGEAARRARAIRNRAAKARADRKKAELHAAATLAGELCRAEGMSLAPGLGRDARNPPAQPVRALDNPAAPPPATATPKTRAAPHEAHGHPAAAPAGANIGQRDVPTQNKTAPAAGKAKRRKVDDVLAHRYNETARRDEYQVKWVGTGASTWERLEDVEGSKHKSRASQLLTGYLKKQPGW